MNDLATYQQSGLPDTIEDVAHFLLIAPERATALRAEIRAIHKVGLAKEVYDQKLEEQRRLCDMILDASVRLGEMTKEIAKAPPNRGNQYTGGKATVLSDSQKSKTDAIHDLGFSPKQVERFETLADNKDLVELEKMTAKEEGRMPTRTNVIDLAKARKDLFDRDLTQIDADAKIAKAFIRAVFAPLTIVDTPEAVAAAVWRNASGRVQGDILDIDSAISILTAIKNKLMNGGKLYGSF